MPSMEFSSLFSSLEPMLVTAVPKSYVCSSLMTPAVKQCLFFRRDRNTANMNKAHLSDVAQLCFIASISDLELSSGETQIAEPFSWKGSENTNPPDSSLPGLRMAAAQTQRARQRCTMRNNIISVRRYVLFHK